MAKKLNKATFNYGGVPFSLTKSTTQAAVRYIPNAQPAKRGMVSPELENFKVVTAKRGIESKLDKLRAMPEVSSGTHVYNFDGEDDVPFIPTGNLYIEFAPEADAEMQQDALDKLHLSIKEIVAPGALRVSVTPESPNPIKCAVALQKNKMVRVAEPEFVTVPSERDFAPPSGRFVATQWHLENTGGPIPIIEVPDAIYGTDHFKKGADAKVKGAWQYIESLGSKNLKIAVIDTGFAVGHPQLKGDGTKVKTSFNAALKTPDVSPLFKYSDGSFGVYSHGTSCAAVAAGAFDSNGILGACPNARIIPIKLDILSDEAIKNAFEHALLNGADIISCSLGFPKPVPLSTYVSNYVARVAREGRGGKGMPIFFAAGNANPNSNNMPRAISDFANHPDIMCITASNSLDQSSDYTFYGNNAFLCAPTNGDPGIGISTATIEIAGDGVSIEYGYTSGFGGTSSATPLAAGVCGLMLSANPNLTLAQVRDILKQTAEKIGGSSAYDSKGHSNYYGFGRINALKAVKMADALLSGGSSTSNSGNTAGTSTPPPVTRQKGKVISKFLNVRTGPSTSYAKVKELKQGDVVELWEKRDNWWRIGSSQYASADYIQPLPMTKTGKVINSFLNVRSGPGVNNAKVGELKLGDIVNIYERTADDWLRIGTGKWVLGKYVQQLSA